MTIRELRILPPFAIGRLGSAKEPLDNYTIEDDPNHPLGFRRIRGAELSSLMRPPAKFGTSGLRKT